MKVSGYKCDECLSWLEEDEVTVATLSFTGRVETKYRLELCVGCVERHEPRDTPVSAPSARRRSPSARRQALSEGAALMAEGMSMADMLGKLHIGKHTWMRWCSEFPDIAGAIES